MLRAHFEDALRGNALRYISPKRVPIYKHFNLHQALDRLEIYLEPTPDFEDGIGGWSISHTKSIAVRPGCGDPVNVAVHEIAHLLLPIRCGRSTTRTKAVDEAEAELTAFLVKRCLGNRIYLSLGRRYIQDAMKKAKPLKPRLELVEKAALQILEAGRTNHRVSPGTDCLGLAIANRDHVAATRSANFFWKNREHEPDERLPMPNGRRNPLSEAYDTTCVECGDDQASYIKGCMDELCKRCVRTRLAWERDNGLIRKSEYRDLVRELAARFE